MSLIRPDSLRDFKTTFKAIDAPASFLGSLYTIQEYDAANNKRGHRDWGANWRTTLHTSWVEPS